MPQVINTNIASLNAQRNLNTSQRDLNTALERLSSGLRINSAKDDAAGLAISDRMTAQIRGYDQASRNANDGISLAQTAEGALGATTTLLQRIRELAIQSANSTNSASDRASLQAEVNQLKQELDRVSSQTEFNGLKLLDGTFTSQAFQVGANANQIINVSLEGSSTSLLQDNQLSKLSATDNMGTGAVVAPNATPPTKSTIGDQTLTINGPLGEIDNLVITDGASAFEVASAISKREGETSVTADATNTLTIGNVGQDGTVSFDLSTSDGGGKKTISAPVTTTDLGSLVTEINRQSGTTGVSAQLSTDKASIQLTQIDGKDVIIGDFNHSHASGKLDVDGMGSGSTETLSGSDDSTRVTGAINFHSSGTFTVSSSMATAVNGGILNVGASILVGSEPKLLSTVDISSSAGSQDAIAIIDASLNQVNAMRASLGAIQNRFEATITSNTLTSENLSAANSRIRDADFAAETAALSRSQVLQQAGVSILAQANALPQQALSLLG